MRTKVIYEEDENRIDIALPLHYYFLAHTAPSFRLTDGEKLILLCVVQAELKKEGLKKAQELKYFGEVPIIEPRTAVGFAPPFDVFEPALNWLGTYDVLDETMDYKDILNEIKELYSDIPDLKGYVYTAIFTKAIRGVKGYCAYITDKDIIVLFWGFDNLIEGHI